MAKAKKEFDLFTGSALDTYFGTPIRQEAEKSTEEKGKTNITDKLIEAPEKTEENAEIVKEEKAAEAVAYTQRRPGRPRNENAAPKKKVTLELQEELIDDINKIIMIAYPAKEKMSLTKVLNQCMDQYVKEHAAELEKYNSIFK